MNSPCQTVSPGVFMGLFGVLASRVPCTAGSGRVYPTALDDAR